MIGIRSISSSKLKRLLPLCRSVCTYTDSVSNTLHKPQLKQNYSLNPSKTLIPFYSFRHFCSSTSVILSRDGNYDESTSKKFPICLGCGVRMQDYDSEQPGFFIQPKPKSPIYKYRLGNMLITDESEISEALEKGVVTDLTTGKEEEIVEDIETQNPKLPLVCARCHSLRNYGKVKNPEVENLLPDFDFNHTVGKRFSSVTGPRTVVLMVVDASDFDGSFPRKVAKVVSETIDEHNASWKKGEPGNVPRVVLVVTKIDLLPSSLNPTGLEHWVRTRAREGGASKLTSVHLVSAVKDWGLKNLIDDVVKLVGPRGHVWTVGAQNAGKSTLINALGKCVGGQLSHLTEAPVPGTTLGIVRVEGVLPAQAKLYDTPGLLHAHQLCTRLTRDEQKLVHITKELRPRTYRIKVGHSIHIAGLLRLDLEESSVESVYITVWASPYLPLHMGKTENVSNMVENHFGCQLQPPIGKCRVAELGKWEKREFNVQGKWWDLSSVDIAASGLGWFAIALKGDATLGVWTYDGVDVVLRNALLPNRSNYFEVAGFTVSKIVSKADTASNKKKSSKNPKTKEIETADSIPL